MAISGKGMDGIDCAQCTRTTARSRKAPKIPLKYQAVKNEQKYKEYAHIERKRKASSKSF
jgi:hypothetical protein